MADPLFPGLPLQGGQLQNIPAGASFTDVVVILNDIIDQLNAQMKTQVFSDTTSKRMIIGYQKAGWDNGTSDFGIKISLPGVDVTTATDSQLLFTMGLTTWNWRNSAGTLFKKLDIDNGIENYYNNGSLVKEYDADTGIETYYTITGTLVKKIDTNKGVEIFYDPSSGLDIGQQGILPDGTGGAAWAKSGDSVSGAIT